MDTKKSNVNTDSQQKSKKGHSGLATAAGMGVASVAGATIGRAFPSGDDQDSHEEVLVDVTPEEIAEENQQEQEQDQSAEQAAQEAKPAEDPAKDVEPTSPEAEQQKEDELEKDPDEVAEKIINVDEIDDPDYGNEIHAVEMRTITDVYGNEQEAMIFADENGTEFALCQSDPESGIFDKWVDPYTLQEEDMPQEISYTRADFEELLHDDGGYIAPDPNGSMFADNDDISKDIKTTDNGEMLAQHNQPSQQIDVDIDELDDPDIDESDEELIAQMLPDDDNGDPEINEDFIDIIDDWFDDEDEEYEDELEEDELEEGEDDEDKDEEDDEDELDEDELDEDELDEDELDED